MPAGLRQEVSLVKLGGVVVAVAGLAVVLWLAGVAGGESRKTGATRSGGGAMQNNQTAAEVGRVTYSDEEWRKRLTPEQYQVLRHKGTERAFTGVYWNEHAAGTYKCAGCGLPLFDSKTKFDSGTGWPSFWQPIAPANVKIVRDTSLGMVREEVVCARCEGHLGHRFDDGPQPTGQRYCMNSVSLELEKPAKTADR
jgi:peptide-methionine (R)-S-oxide reductase